jgi:hypothetical protein
LSNGQITLEESRRLLEDYEQSLRRYTYLSWLGRKNNGCILVSGADWNSAEIRSIRFIVPS